MNTDTITIEVNGKDGKIEVRSFIRIINGTVSALRNLEKTTVENEDQRISWTIEKIKMESPLQLTLVGEGLSESAFDVIGAYVDGIKSLEESGKTIPKHFNLTTLNLVKKIMSYVNNGIDSITFSIPGKESVSPTAKTFASLVLLTEPKVKSYTMETQIEGRLEQINTHGKKHEFCIFDPLTDDGITCIFENVEPLEIGKLITKRVRVTGEASFNRKHKPTKIKVSKYKVLREQNELPQLADLHKSNINITGGKDSFAFIRELRNGTYK